ncbi:hypothetical protein C8J57DRAFT_1667762 [Mycena rebaudengoi]|nr:hypothetical protein C8J57DRAFT_1667762 [Mycena rebaudengoi]
MTPLLAEDILVYRAELFTLFTLILALKLIFSAPPSHSLFSFELTLGLLWVSPQTLVALAYGFCRNIYFNNPSVCCVDVPHEVHVVLESLELELETDPSLVIDSSPITPLLRANAQTIQKVRITSSYSPFNCPSLSFTLLTRTENTDLRVSEPPYPDIFPTTCTFLITCATLRRPHPALQGPQLVRNPAASPALALEALGATLFKGNLADVAAVTAATQGVTWTHQNFLNPFLDFTNPNGDAEAAQTVVDAAGTVASIVFSTVLRANSAAARSTPRGSRSWRCTTTARRARSALFRLLTTTYPAGYRLDHLDAADVGNFAAAAFLAPERFAGKQIDLVNELLTFEEIAAQLSEAAGVEVTFGQRTQEETDTLKATMPMIEIQLWAPKALEVDLREYRIELTSFKDETDHVKYIERKNTQIC